MAAGTPAAAIIIIVVVVVATAVAGDNGAAHTERLSGAAVSARRAPLIIRSAGETGRLTEPMTHIRRTDTDLVAKSKSFVAKHGPGATAAAGRASNFDSAGAGSAGGPFGRAGNEIGAPNRGARCTESANRNHNHRPHGADNCYNAFDNPYFADARKDCLLAQQQQQQQRQVRSPEAQQLHFIENRISTLHSKQVTSSVNELSAANQRPQPGKCRPLIQRPQVDTCARNLRAIMNERRQRTRPRRLLTNRSPYAQII